MHYQEINYGGNPLQPVGEAQACRVRPVKFMPNIVIQKGQLLGQVAAASANEIQTLTFAGVWAAGDTFTLSFGHNWCKTPELAQDIPNEDLQAAIQQILENAGYDGITVSVSDGPAPANVTVTFGGAAAWDLILMTATATTAGDGTLAVASTQSGSLSGLWGAYDDALLDGRQVARAISMYSFATDANGRIALKQPGDIPASGPLIDGFSEIGQAIQEIEVYFSGLFRTQDLTGLDANAVADLGRIEEGDFGRGVLVVI